MGISFARRFPALALAGMIALAPAAPLLAASLPQLEQAVRDSGLVGAAFRVTRRGQALLVETNQIYPNRDELKLALVQLAGLLETTDNKLQKVTLRANLLNKPDPVEGSIAPRTAVQLQRTGDPDMLEKVRLATVKGRRPTLVAVRPAPDGSNIPVLGDPIERNGQPTGQPRADLNLPVLGDPIVPGQRVADPARGTGDEPPPAPALRTGIAVLRAGSALPILLDRDVNVSGNQPAQVSAVVLQDILNESGELVIPGGSQVRGQVEPTPSGARLVLTELSMNGRTYPIRATTAVFPAQVQGGGGFGGGALVGGVLGGFGGSLLGQSFDRRSGGLWGGLLGGLLGSFLGGAATPQPRRVVVIPAGATNTQLLEDVAISP